MDIGDSPSLSISLQGETEIYVGSGIGETDVRFQFGFSGLLRIDTDIGDIEILAIADWIIIQDADLSFRLFRILADQAQQIRGEDSVGGIPQIVGSLGGLIALVEAGNEHFRRCRALTAGIDPT